MSYDVYKADGLCFLTQPCGETKVFAPEYFSQQQVQMGQEVERFIVNEIYPIMDRIDQKEDGLLVKYLKKAGELGFLAIDVPEKYEGMGMDKATSMLVTEKMVPAGSFAVAVLTHTGIGTLPIVFFGTEEQKRKYLPKLAYGELIGCYALTEAGSGSDALGAKAKAVLDESGKYYILNGEKMFITNAGFADLCTVFAKVDGEKFTAFIVDTKTEGFSVGPEEHKMGIAGSSTCPVILEDVKVPVENVLGLIGKGHKVAFNILNVGRFKLGAGCVGACKEVLAVSAQYANERIQFKRPISSFGAIRQKLAFMMIKTYILESMTYRTAGLMDSAIELIDKTKADADEKTIQAIEDYAVEQSVMKVYGSEAFDQCVDEGVQIHGGYGYIKEYFVERAYRDSRINRIFEGTNEINRILIPSMTMRRVFKGKFPFAELINKAEEAAKDEGKMPVQDSVPLSSEATIVDRVKLAVIYALNLVNTRHMMDLMDHKKGQTQMALLAIAELMIEAYALDSAVARTRQLVQEKGEEKARIPILLTKCYMAEVLPKIKAIGEDIIVNTSEEGGVEKNLEKFNRFLIMPRWKTHDMKDEIAAHVIGRERYSLV